jgi:hypothetical protein
MVTKAVTIQIRVSEEEKATWGAQAKAEGLGLSAWIRNTLAWTLVGTHPMEVRLSVPQVQRALQSQTEPPEEAPIEPFPGFVVTPFSGPEGQPAGQVTVVPRPRCTPHRGLLPCVQCGNEGSVRG